MTTPIMVKTTIYVHPPKGTFPNKSDMLKATEVYNPYTVPDNLLSRNILVDADSLLFKACLDSAGENSKSSGMEPLLETCIDKFKGLLKKTLYDLVKACEPHLSNAAAYQRVAQLEPILYFTGRDNFRSRLYHNYKNNRKKNPSIAVEIYGEQIDEDTIRTKDGTLIINKELRIHRIKQALGAEYITQERHSLEADDLIAMSLSFEGFTDNSIVVSSDKDLLTVECTLFNNHSSPGILSRIDAITAQRNFFIQCLTGDSVDCYPGIPGATGEDVFKLVEEYGPNAETGVISEEELSNRLREIYCIFLGPTAGVGLADTNMQCAYLLRSPDMDKGFVRVYGQKDKWLKL